MKKTTLLTGLLLTLGISGVASAHDYGGTLGTAATATDKFYITCATGTAKITYQIRRNAGTPKVKTNPYSPVGAVTQETTTGVFSPLITLNTTGGAKFFQVGKVSGTGTDSYTLRMHCWDSAGNHNPDDQPMSVTYVQNQ